LNWLLISLLVASSIPAARPIDFDTDIEPLLTRYGCNAGSCHGAAAGRGGFSLSLYGSVPERDFEAIVQQLEGRRVNLAHPEESLLFLKATESVSHQGGPRFDIDSPAARLLLDWIRQGAMRDTDRQLRQLDVAPAKISMRRIGERSRLSVSATFSDSTAHDVTAWSVLTADDPSAVKVSPDGDVTVSRPGRHLVTVRYLDRLIPVEVLLPFRFSDESVQQNSTTPGASSAVNIVDREIDQRLRELHLPKSGAASRETFLRRASLRLTGRLPAPDAIAKFVASTDRSDDSERLRTFDAHSQRPAPANARLIDDLLDSEAFDEFWTYQFIKLLKVKASPQRETSARTAYEWLRAQIAADNPLDQVAREMVTATGATTENGATAFYLAAGDARKQAEFVSELFLGVRLRCANCHDHPLDQWTQDDYHGLAAIFAPIRRGASITVGTSGDVIHPRTGGPAIPKLPAGRFLNADEDRLSTFARWLTSRDNAWFDRAIVNRVWKLLMGRGLVEPVDDLRASNAATHPRLLGELAREFARGGRRIRPLIRTVCCSESFARSSVPVRADVHENSFYSHAVAVELQPEVFLDAIADVTGIRTMFPESIRAGDRVINLVARDVKSATLDVLGRCSADAECATGNSAAPLPRALLLINGSVLNDRLSASSGTLTALLTQEASNRELVSHFYRRALTRDPTTAELDFWAGQLDQADNEQQRRAMAEDFLWGLLTCREFVTCR
jgi:hypothetical protein